MSDKDQYDPLSFWDNRYRQFNITTSGHIDLPYKFNYWMYKIKLNKVRQATKRHVTAAQLKKSSVVDLGCGTGVYVKQWEELQVKKLVGMDISPRAVANLQKTHPKYEFYCEDLANTDIPSLYGKNQHDIVTAIGVLVHILDDNDFRKALQNISGLVKNDGVVILAEYLRRGEAQEGSYMKVRSIKWYKEELRKVGMEVIEHSPLYYFMGRPYDAHSAVSQFFLPLIFNFNRRLVRRFPGLMGRALYLADSIITKFMTDGPSEELLVCRKIPQT